MRIVDKRIKHDKKTVGGIPCGSHFINCGQLFQISTFVSTDSVKCINVASGDLIDFKFNILVDHVECEVNILKDI